MKSTRMAEGPLQWDRVDPFRDDSVELRDEPERTDHTEPWIVDRVEVLCDSQERVMLKLRS